MKSTKICRLCKLEKELSSFYKHRETKDRLRHECKDCINELTLKYYFDNKDHIVYKRKDYHYRKNYGISLEELTKIKEDQDHTCPICLRKVSLVVDHNHKTGKIRNLLCNKCNQALGSLDENVENFRRAIKYLEKHY